MNAPLQTRGEEIFNAITHGLGAGLGVVGLVLLLFAASARGDVLPMVAAATFGGTLVLLYLWSTLYHSLPRGRAKRVFQYLDHIGIYLLIAGTYTLVALTALRGPMRWYLLLAQWGMATVGIIVKAIGGPERFERLSTGFYVLMGWMGVVVISELVQQLSTASLALLLGGGMLYTLGVPFFLLDQRRRFFHSVWHLFVLGGSICHGLLAYGLVQLHG